MGFADLLPLLMFMVLTPLLFSGFPVAFVLGGVGLAFWALAVGLGLERPETFFLVISRIYGGVVAKPLLVAIPLFVFMGTVLESSGVARNLLDMMQHLTRRVPGGLAIAVTLLGVILAATTGIIGASVVMMTLLALPSMLEAGYRADLAAGTVAASGTLGILLPPSIMLVVMADLLSISAGDLFLAAVLPSLLLATLYIAYILIRGILRPEDAPRAPAEAKASAISFLDILRAILPTALLITAVLGSIFAGLATPTEASAVGAAGALGVALMNGSLNLRTLQAAVERTALTSAMIFGLFIGATAFSYMFTLLGGHDLILGGLEAAEAGPWTILLLLMMVVFLLGFFFDWIEITLIILPVFAPVIASLDFSPHVPAGMGVVWFAILMAVNLQTSFLTPPFGFALFYLKGAASAEVRLSDIYRGIIPFILLQLMALAAVALWPGVALWLPNTTG